MAGDSPGSPGSHPARAPAAQKRGSGKTARAFVHLLVISCLLRQIIKSNAACLQDAPANNEYNNENIEQERQVEGFHDRKLVQVGCDESPEGIQHECICSNGNQATGNLCTAQGEEICTSCDSGYYLTAGLECALNSCTCSGGRGASGNACPTHNTAHCASCTGSRYLKNGACPAWTVCTSAQYETTSPTTSSNRVCTTKQCTCSGGTGASGNACPTHDTAHCASCTGSRYLNDGACPAWTVCTSAQYETTSPTTSRNRVCTTKQCTCSGGTGATGKSCPNNGNAKCILCNRGFYLSNNQCLECSPLSNCLGTTSCSTGPTTDRTCDISCEDNCADCADVNTCTACSSNYFLKSSDCVTSDNCGAGFFADTSKDPDSCTACENNCDTCSDSATCTACSSNYFLKSSDCVTSGNCGAGFFADTSADPDACTACENNCDTCSDGTTCTACSSNYFLENGNCTLSLCVEFQKEGYELSNQYGDITIKDFDPKGLFCAAGYKGSVSTTVCVQHNAAYSVAGCTPCEAGKYQPLSDAETVSCITCDAGKYSDSVGSTSHTTCKFCPAGFAFESSNVACKGCSPGEYQNQNDASNVKCEVCDSGKFANSSNTAVCRSCPPGKNLVTSPIASSHDEAEDCELCEVGKYNYLPGLGQDCFECDTAKTIGSTYCIGCDPGMFLNNVQPGSDDCNQCGPGRYSTTRNAEECENCPSGYHGVEITETTARIHCQACPRGTFGNSERLENDTLCKACAAGRYSDLDALKDDACKKCRSGLWSDETGLQESVGCKNCAAGRYSTKTASTNISACLPCGAGKYSATVGLEDPNQCLSCPAGFYQGEQGQAFCLPCVPGKYQDDDNGITCKDCGVNEFADKTMMKQCLICDIGKEAVNSGSVSCSVCGAGKFGEVGPVCTECERGRFRKGDAASAVSCESCPGGFYQVEQGQASCLPCVPGKYQDDDNGITCKDCGVNEFADKTMMKQCHVCPIGKVAVNPGSVSCSVCGAGKFREAGPVCTECERGRFRKGDAASAVSCESCPGGFSQGVRGQASCLPCVPGKYQDDDNGITCKVCPEGSFAEDYGIVSNCTDCPTGFTSKRGSSGCDKCEIGKYGIDNGMDENPCQICPPGLYSDARGKETCEQCPIGKIPNLNGTACEKPPWKTEIDCDLESEYLNNIDSDPKKWKCERCMIGADCKTYRTLGSLLPKDGWWTVPKEYDPEPEEYYLLCPYPKDCLWEASRNSSCVNGTRGVGCSVCEVGWDRIGRECNECYDGELAFRSGGLLGVILFMSVLLCASRNSLRRLKRKRPGLWRDVMLLIKILVSFTQ